MPMHDNVGHQRWLDTFKTQKIGVKVAVSCQDVYLMSGGGRGICQW